MTRPDRAASNAASEVYEPLTPEERSNQYKHLNEELRAHAGYRARLLWDALGRSEMVWNRNTRELLALLKALENEEELKVELIQNVRQPTMRNEIMGQLDQRLHNMLTAAVSLVDHTRRHMSKYKNSDFAKEFEERNSLITNAPSTAFLRRLRNYLLHIGTAPISVHATIGGPATDAIQLGVRLDSKALLEWDDWNVASREYISSFPDGVPLLTTVEAYAAHMGDLYT